MGKIVSINPFTEEIIKEIEETPADQIPEMVKKAKSAQKEWGKVPLEKRVEIIGKLIPLFKENKDKLAQIIHEEVGKPLGKAEGDAEDSVNQVEFYLKKVPLALKEVVVDENEKEKSVMCFDPIGVVAVITPWNYPLDTPLLSIVPALLTGNSVLFKPSEHTTLTGIELFNILKELEKEGMPENTVQLIIGGKEIGKLLVQQDVDMVSFTGSGRAGKEIMKDSSEKLHKILLELGGKDPAIVLKDVDIEKTAKAIVTGATVNTGQVCCSIERVYVQKEIFDDFVEKVVEEAKKVSIDHGNNPDADIGPLIRDFQLKIVEDHIKDAEEKGVKVLTGGKHPDGKGYFFPPTVLTNVTDDMKVMKDETFGPVIPIESFDTVEEAIKKANDTKFGLTSSVWTKDLEKGKEIAGKLVAGTTSINASNVYKLGAPWGGAKQSGLGRMHTVEGVREFTNIRHLMIKKA